MSNESQKINKKIKLQKIFLDRATGTCLSKYRIFSSKFCLQLSKNTEPLGANLNEILLVFEIAIHTIVKAFVAWFQ